MVAISCVDVRADGRSVYIVVRGPLAMARLAHAHITKVRAPHLSMISDPGVVTQVIVEAAHATG